MIRLLRVLGSRLIKSYRGARIRVQQPKAFIIPVATETLAGLRQWSSDVHADANSDVEVNTNTVASPDTLKNSDPLAEAHPVSFPDITVCRETAAFDGYRAFELLERQCALGPRIPGTVAHSATRDLIMRELAWSTDEIAQQPWNQPIARGPGAGHTFPMTNLFALLRGRDALDVPRARISPDVMICAHWDTRPIADQDPEISKRRDPVPGANDGASGVAVILELARALRAERPAISVAFALWDGEDLGEYYYGSRLFGRMVRRPDFAPWRPRQAVLLDMVGKANLRCTNELNSLQSAASLWNEVHAVAADLGLDRHFHGTVRRIMDDHVFLNRANIPTILLIDYNYPYWHTTEDTIDKCSAESLQIIGDVMLRFIRTRPRNGTP